ncbi:MAG: TerC family protein [Woeseiaceae bacterium]|nr:TerC family protein [Woeseiaceae bacterium]
MDYLLALLTDPTAWMALATLTLMEVVLGIDNLIFISVLSNKLPEKDRSRARRLGIAGALVMRLALLGTIAMIVRMTAPLFELFGQAFSWRDLIMIAGGLFLVWKATTEIHDSVDPDADPHGTKSAAAITSVGTVVAQILVLDLVFSIDSIITAVGMTEHVPIMVFAVIFAIGTMLLAADPLARFIHANPTIVMLALGFLLLIGTTLIAEGFGVHVPKGYIYAAMAFSALVEALNMFARRARRRRAASRWIASRACRVAAHPRVGKAACRRRYAQRPAVAVAAYQSCCRSDASASICAGDSPQQPPMICTPDASQPPA